MRPLSVSKTRQSDGFFNKPRGHADLRGRVTLSNIHHKLQTSFLTQLWHVVFVVVVRALSFFFLAQWGVIADVLSELAFIFTSKQSGSGNLLLVVLFARWLCHFFCFPTNTRAQLIWICETPKNICGRERLVWKEHLTFKITLITLELCRVSQAVQNLPRQSFLHSSNQKNSLDIKDILLYSVAL